MYLDKPMRNHSLMQTIARANRVFPGKHSGVIVDYANVFASLERALAIYGAGTGGGSPVSNKQELAEALQQAIATATSYCSARGVDLAALEAPALGGIQRLASLENAVNLLVAPEAVRREFFGHERLVATLYRAVKPDPVVVAFALRVATIAAVADAIRAKLSPNPVDITSILGRISVLLDESITGLEVRESGPAPLDLSKINFEALARRFKESRRQNTDLEVLKAAVRAKLDVLVRLNRTRTDFAEKFEALIDSYNAGSRSIDDLFEELLELSNSLDDEQQRHVRENLSEEELVVFDILTRPAPELTTAERAELKKFARDLLARLKGLLVPNWRQRVGARSAMQMAIDEALDGGLPRAYSPDLYRQKCSAVFEHVYESYPERGTGVYGVAPQ